MFLCAPHLNCGEMIAGIAQLVEQRIRNAKVVGSIPISGTNIIKDLRVFDVV